MRTERDVIGPLEVPADAYYGIFTQRASGNFRISGIKAGRELIAALGLIKKSAAAANISLGLLDRKVGSAIISAADEVIAGKHDSQFILDAFQAGAGTPFNMNANEVIANLAIKKLGGRPGDYAVVHPNNHVNMAQSSNDVIPTSIRIASLLMARGFLSELEKLAASFDRKSREFRGVVKVGRTHLMDAVPITYAQVFASYAASMRRCAYRIESAKTGLLELGIGGTAVGTGITAHPEFRARSVSELCKHTGMKFRPAADIVETTWSCDAFLHFANALRSLAVELRKVSHDLMLLGSGPKAGIGELLLPEVEPGSSIMPGKINPSVPECLSMIAMQVQGNCHAVELGAAAGELELNVATPVIGFNLFWSMELLENGMRMLRELCIRGIKLNRPRISGLLEESLCLATALNPYLGYEVVGQLVRQANKEGKPLSDVILEKRLVPEKELGRILNAAAVTAPQKVDAALVRKIQGSGAFKSFRQKLYTAKSPTN